ncbi:YlbD family protein [Halalkalibacterium ligniniphilum]|uniref:YlbD family protein n=1 Tax=Halalkalibacterium ligniniphilum TaxID=1134413 RepID=UPI000344D64F|nr:YlbD family protein [Halalkalibacterium ligniniphilum]
MSENTELHPSVAEFKAFVKEHPLIIRDVRDGDKTLQEFFEEWSILGADHESWDVYKRRSHETNGDKQLIETEGTSEEGENKETVGYLLNMLKSINLTDLQQHLSQFGTVLNNVQNLMQSFQKPGNQQGQNEVDHPFSFRRD